MTDLSIIIPARNEMFLKNTIDDILKNMRADTEIIAVLDGVWACPPIDDNPKVRLIYHSQSIGQRAACNEAVRLSQAKYIMKVDAHCAFDEGFDAKMIADMQPDWTFVPVMRNLHVFDWVCPDGHRRYQSPSGPCAYEIAPDVKCGKPTTMDIVWIAKRSPQSTSYCFDPTPHFQYFGEFKHRPEGQGPFSETMSLQGSCFMMARERYLDLDVCGEEFGSWGSQGIEVAVKSWLSGGRVMVNHKTWYAHCFRTQGGDFGFPYHLSGKQVEHAKKMAHSMFFENKWCKQVHPLSWLVEKFWPVPGWTEENLAELKKSDINIPTYIPKHAEKGMVYYTDNRLDPQIMTACQKQLLKCTNGYPIVSVSLQPMDFGANIHMNLERSYLTMFKQILAGLEACDADIIFLCEHDILYSPSHFDFVPARKDVFYYNNNSWKVDSRTGQALFYYCNQTFALCAYRDLLLEHYRKRVERVEREGSFDRHIGFEPGTHSFPRGIDNYGWEAWMSAQPNLDIRHGLNLTKSRWSQDEFRNKKFCQGWTMADEVPGWGFTKGRFDQILKEINNG